MAELTTEQKIDSILETVSKIQKDMVAREYLDQKVKEHDEFINGNGKPGAKSQLAVIQSSQQRISAINMAIVIALAIDVIMGLIN